jgi:hypothetical protein
MWTIASARAHPLDLCNNSAHGLARPAGAHGCDTLGHRREHDTWPDTNGAAQSSVADGSSPVSRHDLAPMAAGVDGWALWIGAGVGGSGSRTRTGISSFLFASSLCRACTVCHRDHVLVRRTEAGHSRCSPHRCEQLAARRKLSRHFSHHNRGAWISRACRRSSSSMTTPMCVRQ